jgi:hypothetical protein
VREEVQLQRPESVLRASAWEPEEGGLQEEDQLQPWEVEEVEQREEVQLQTWEPVGQAVRVEALEREPGLLALESAQEGAPEEPLASASGEVGLLASASGEVGLLASASGEGRASPSEQPPAWLRESAVGKETLRG